MAVVSSIATCEPVVGKLPRTGLNDSNRGGDTEPMKAGAFGVVTRLRCVSSSVPGVKIAPAASATPGVRLTVSSICSVTGETSERTWRPRICDGETTTSCPLLAVWKIVAKEPLIVSVRM